MKQPKIRSRCIHIKNQLAVLISSATLAVGVQAAPEITSIEAGDESRLVIHGSGFGSGPSVKLYDDFSRAEQRNGTLALSALVGQWNWLSSTPTGIISAGMADNGKGIYVLKHEESRVSLEFGVPDPESVHGYEHFQEVYLSYTVKDFGDFPGPGGGPETFSDRSSIKDAWLMFGSRGDNTSYAVSQGSPAGHDLVATTWTGGSFATGGNNTRMSPSFWHHPLRDNWAFQDWNTIMFHAKLNPDDPYGDAEGFLGFTNRNMTHFRSREGNFMTDQTDEGVPYPYWDRVKFYAWMRGGENVARAMDNVYVATGANANARVVLTDTSYDENPGKLIHALPLEWSDSRITVELPRGFNPEDLTLTVINSGESNSNSIPVTLCLECPESITLDVD